MCEEVTNRGYKKVGLLGTIFTMEQDYMKKDLLDAGVEVFVPEKDDRYKDFYEQLRREEVLSKRPEAPWKADVPEGDFISPYPTYECGKYFNLFKECSYTDSSGMTLKYYFYV